MAERPVTAAIAALTKVQAEITDMYPEDERNISSAIAALQKYKRRELRQSSGR